MSTRQGYLQDHEENRVAPATTSAMVADVAKNQALSQTLVNTPDKNALGFPAFLTTRSYDAGEKVYNLNKLWMFTANHPAGAWTGNDATEISIKEYIDDLVSSDSATFRGTYNEVSDLELTPAATRTEIATALASAVSTADNNDYAFVQIPTDASTPTEIARIERYKFNGSDWAFEYELNNSGFTTAQWAAINSGITTEKVAKLDALPTAANLYTKEQVDAMIADIEENYLKKGTYSADTAVGLADNLRGQTVDSDAYLIRPTGSTENEVANGVASVLGMEGNSCVWNQLIKNGDFSSGTNNWSNSSAGSISASNNSLILTATSSSLSVYAKQTVSIPKEHKYYFKASVKASINTTSTRISFGSGTSERVAHTPLTANVKQEISSIKTHSTNNELRIYFDADTAPAVNDTLTINDVQIIDLTLLGIDNLTTVAQVEAWLAEHVGTKPYYTYNAGTILSAQTLGIKTYGQNLLNPTTKQAKLIPYTWVENNTDYSNQYTIKNIPSGTTATFTPDATGVAESVTITNDKFDITSYGSGILELSAATADTYVCIRWNGTKDNDVVPYEDHTYDFDVRKVYGKVSGAGEYVQCYPNGMRSEGSAKDSLTASEAVVKIGSVDLGRDVRSWEYVSPDNYVRITNTIIGIQKKSIAISSKYIYGGQESSAISNSQFYVGNTYFGIKDSSISAEDVVNRTIAKLNDVELVYQLATPITYTDLIYRDGGIDRPLADVLMNITVNNWSMEEQLMTPYENGNPTSIPATIKTQYGMDAVEAIDTLQKTCYFADDVHANLQALLTCVNTNCAETLGGTFAISETATDKVFEFTFTPNTEPEP